MPDLNLAAIAADNARAAELGPGVAFAVQWLRFLAATTPDQDRAANFNFAADFVARKELEF